MIYYAADVPFIFITIVTARKNTKVKNVCGFITHSYEVMPLAVDPCLFANPYKCRHVCNGEPTANFWQQATCLMVLRQMPVRPALLRPIHASPNEVNPMPDASLTSSRLRLEGNAN
ncbi:hypothetical protein [Brucella cytisi]|uniref:hypothetical protein n=1 Tax=Brucella cytisi TaxID=407152 RepID=UPI00313ECF28